jgi:4-oxalocrotonate tautomerase
LPHVHISIREGREPDRVRALISAVTTAGAAALDAPLGSVVVLITEVPAANWANGDVTLAEKSVARRIGESETTAGAQ